MLKHYRVKVGYRDDEFLSVSENELPKAQVLFLEGTGRGLFEEGAIRGNDIMRILPDFHRARGWNRSWKMQDEDYADIQHLERPYRDTYQLAENIAKEIISQNRRDLLSENKSLEELEQIVIQGLPEADIKKLN